MLSENEKYNLFELSINNKSINCLIVHYSSYLKINSFPELNHTIWFITKQSHMPHFAVVLRF